ncbi:MAG: hypothetical protein R3F11_15565 [Verrucomicrobiales bacterium]
MKRCLAPLAVLAIAEARGWTRHFSGGVLVSACFRHFKVDLPGVIRLAKAALVQDRNAEPAAAQ